MELTKVSKSEWKDIKDIYVEAFPKQERKPFYMLKNSVRKGKSQIFVAKQNNLFLGFIAITPYNDIVMVDYLAVSSKIRSSGTASKILQKIFDYYQNRKIILLIERLDENANNSHQRIARKRFYLKNGFISSGISINGLSGNMEILCWGGNISADEYITVHSYSLGRLLFTLSRIKVVS